MAKGVAAILKDITDEIDSLQTSLLATKQAMDNAVAAFDTVNNQITALKKAKTAIENKP